MCENYRCFICGQHFEMACDLIDHVDDVHPEVNARGDAEITPYCGQGAASLC